MSNQIELDPLPGPVRTARVLLFVQGGLLALGSASITAVLVGSPTADVASVIMVVVNLVQAGVLLACATWIRSSAFRVAAVVVEAIGLAAALFNAIMVTPAMLIGVVLPLLVLIALNREGVSEWYQRKTPAAAQADLAE